MYSTEDLIVLFSENSAPKYAIPMKKYMKNHFEFFGIKSPHRKELTRLFIKNNGLPKPEELRDFVKDCWNAPQREMQYAGMEIADRVVKRSDIKFMDLYEYMITHRSWWDTVDMIAAKLVGRELKVSPRQIEACVERWTNSDNMWLQRTAILFQLSYKKDTDKDLLFALCNRFSGDKEFFIRKAIGWALREYAKTDPAAVLEFVNSHELSGLSRREALKHIG